MEGDLDEGAILQRKICEVGVEAAQHSLVCYDDDVLFLTLKLEHDGFHALDQI